MMMKFLALWLQLLPQKIQMMQSVLQMEPFGLGAAVFTQNAALAEHIAKNELAAGSCFVNEGVRSDPALPFGGINQSGYGRELGMFGIHEFVNIKTVYIK